MINNLLRIHNSNNHEIDLTKSYEQINELKPDGLWYSPGFNWIEWVRSNIPEKTALHYYLLELDLTHICVITNSTELDNFFKLYSLEENLFLIDWNKVKKDYAGIEFYNVNETEYNPFNISNHGKTNLKDFIKYNLIRRLDVDSGCIWDLNVITRINKII